LDAAQWQAFGAFDKLLIDPPRDGAMELVKLIGADGPRRIVYVSCSPSTLARDAEVLVAVHGYTLRAAGIVNMFPHTAHVESIALFERGIGFCRQQKSGPQAAFFAEQSGQTGSYLKRLTFDMLVPSMRIRLVGPSRFGECRSPSL